MLKQLTTTIFIIATCLGSGFALFVFAQDDLEYYCETDQVVYEIDFGAIFDLSLSPTAEFFALSTVSGTTVLATETFEFVEFPSENSELFTGSFVSAWAADNTSFAEYRISADGDTVLNIWDFSTLDLAQTITEPSDFEFYGDAISWAPNSAWLAMVGSSGNYVWEVETGEIVFRPAVLVGSTIPDWYTRLTNVIAWSPDSRYLALPDGLNVRIYDTESWEEAHIIETEFTGILSLTNLDWSTNGLLAVGGGFNIQVWDTTTWEQVLLPEPENDGRYWGIAARWSADGSLLAISSEEIHIINVEQGEVVQTLPSVVSAYPVGAAPLEIEWFPDNSRIITRQMDGNIYLWDWENECILNGLVNTIAPRQSG